MTRLARRNRTRHIKLWTHRGLVYRRGRFWKPSQFLPFVLNDTEMRNFSVKYRPRGSLPPSVLVDRVMRRDTYVPFEEPLP